MPRSPNPRPQGAVSKQCGPIGASRTPVAGPSMSSSHEDDARTRKNNAPQNLAVLRRMALDILTAHPDTRSPARKMSLAAWRQDFFFELFAHAIILPPRGASCRRLGDAIAREGRLANSVDGPTLPMRIPRTKSRIESRGSMMQFRAEPAAFQAKCLRNNQLQHTQTHLDGTGWVVQSRSRIRPSPRECLVPNVFFRRDRGSAASRPTITKK